MAASGGAGVAGWRDGPPSAALGPDRTTFRSTWTVPGSWHAFGGHPANRPPVRAAEGPLRFMCWPVQGSWVRPVRIGCWPGPAEPQSQEAWNPPEALFGGVHATERRDRGRRIGRSGSGRAPGRRSCEGPAAGPRLVVGAVAGPGVSILSPSRTNIVAFGSGGHRAAFLDHLAAHRRAWAGTIAPGVIRLVTPPPTWDDEAIEAVCRLIVKGGPDGRSRPNSSARSPPWCARGVPPTPTNRRVGGRRDAGPGGAAAGVEGPRVHLRRRRQGSLDPATDPLRAWSRGGATRRRRPGRSWGSRPITGWVTADGELEDELELRGAAWFELIRLRESRWRSWHPTRRPCSSARAYVNHREPQGHGVGGPSTRFAPGRRQFPTTFRTKDRPTKVETLYLSGTLETGCVGRRVGHHRSEGRPPSLVTPVNWARAGECAPARRGSRPGRGCRAGGIGPVGRGIPPDHAHPEEFRLFWEDWFPSIGGSCTVDMDAFYASVEAPGRSEPGRPCP